MTKLEEQHKKIFEQCMKEYIAKNTKEFIKKQKDKETVNFNFNGKYAMLTYKTHITVARFEKMLTDNKWENKTRYKMFHEKGESGYLHTHVAITWFITKEHIRNCRKADIDGIHCHIKRILSKEHWDRATGYDKSKKKGDVLEYETAENTLTGNEYTWNGDLRNKIQQHKNWKSVMNDDSIWTKENKRLMSWVKETYHAKPTPKLCKPDFKLRKWQKEVLKILDKQTRRQITWIWDKKGDKGKSVLTDYLIDNGAVMFNNGKVADITFAYEGEEIVIFDLPRTTIDNDGKDWTPYRILEMFKDRRLFSPKYQSTMKVCHPEQKVVVFTNFRPDIEAVSKDRWNIYHIEENHELVLEVLNIKKGTSPVEKKKSLPLTKDAKLHTKLDIVSKKALSLISEFSTKMDKENIWVDCDDEIGANDDDPEEFGDYLDTLETVFNDEKCKLERDKIIITIDKG